MRYNEILNESIIRLVNGFGDFIVFKNPIKPQVVNLFKKIKAKDTGYESDNYAKGFISNSDLYIWDPIDATHSGVWELLGVGGWEDNLTNFDFYIKFNEKKFIPLDVMQNSLRKRSPGAIILKQKVNKWNS